MKITMKRFDLIQATQTVQNMVNPQSSTPILGSILIKTDESGCLFMASDNDSCVKRQVEAQVEIEGAVAIQSKTLSELARDLPDTDILLSTDEKNNALIECDNTSYRLTMMDPDKFPEWPYIESQTTFTLSQKEMRKAIDSVIFAIPVRDPRKVLMGALFDLKEGKLITVATDGKKLGFYAQEPTETIGEQDGQAIVPQKLLREVQKQMSDEGEVTITLGQRQVSFDMGHCVFIGNKIDGAYPNYEMVIPKNFEQVITLNRTELTQTIKRAAIISDEKNNSIILKFNGPQLEVTSMSYELGSFAGSMGAECHDDLDFEIVFNHRFVVEALNILKSEKIDLKVNKPMSPAVITMQGDDKSLFLVMPLRLDRSGVNK